MQQEGVTRAELDAAVLRSHRLAAAAWREGLLDDVVLPLSECARDTGIRPQLTQRLLDRLPPHFGPGTLLNAGNACAIHDGAAFLLLASDAFLRRQRWKPLVRLVATASRGGNPQESPRGAMRTADFLLAQQGLRYEDLAAIEFNEAFAVRAGARRLSGSLQPPRRGTGLRSSVRRIRRCPSPALAAIAAAGGRRLRAPVHRRCRRHGRGNLAGMLLSREIEEEWSQDE